MNSGKFLQKLIASIAVFLSLCACQNTQVKWAAERGELRDLPVMAVSEGKGGPADLDVESLLLAPSRIPQALASGKADAAYMDAHEAMTQIAKHSIKAQILAITYRDVEGKPERLLLAEAGWIRENPEGSEELLAAHRAGISYLVDNAPEAIRLAEKMAPDVEINRKKFPGDHRWESGMDVADLIGILDKLRLSDKITPEQADKLALRMVRHESLLEQW